MSAPSPDDLLDALLDLQHDLGKYLRLPLAWLPPDAHESEVMAATVKALTCTREGPGGVRPASTIWADFRTEVGDALTAFRGWAVLTAAVARALAWRDNLSSPLPRERVLADFTAVGVAISALIEESRNGE
jgi:hypothetical protein